MATADPRDVHGGPHGDLPISTLQRWRLAKEAGARANRNVLQYAASLAAILGIGSGAGAVLAVARALSKDESAPHGLSLAVRYGLFVALAVLSLALFWGLGANYVRRRLAERESDKCLKELIAADPMHFWPREA